VIPVLNIYVTFINFINELKNLNDGNTDQEKYEKAIAQVLITTWDTTVAYGDSSANPPIPPYTAQQAKDFVLTNVQNNNILSATYDSYINACKIAFTYFQ
jgi:hypothetical protein